MVELANPISQEIVEDVDSLYSGSAPRHPFAELLSHLKETHGFRPDIRISPSAHGRFEKWADSTRGSLPAPKLLPQMALALNIDAPDARKLFNT